MYTVTLPLRLYAGTPTASVLRSSTDAGMTTSINLALIRLSEGRHANTRDRYPRGATLCILLLKTTYYNCFVLTLFIKYFIGINNRFDYNILFNIL